MPLDDGRISSRESLIRKETAPLHKGARGLLTVVASRNWKSAARRSKPASELDLDSGAEIITNLKRKYGSDLDHQFVVNRELLANAPSRWQRCLDSSVRIAAAPSTATLTQPSYEQYPRRNRNADRRPQDHDDRSTSASSAKPVMASPA